MITIFAILPQDILEYELRPRLDDISLLCLRIALNLQDLPEKLTTEQQEQVVSHGLSLTKYFDSEDLLDDEYLCYRAMKFGRVNVLEYVVDCEYPLSFNNVHVAARYGHIHCLQWWYDKYHTSDFDNIMWGRYICDVAAQHGQLECLEFLRIHGAPLSRSTIIIAMEYGQLSCLKYMYESGIPLDGIADYAAASLLCLQYVIEQGMMVDEQTLVVAAEYNNVDCMKLLYNMGINTDENLCEITSSIQATQYAMSIGNYLTSDCMLTAVEVNDIDMVRFLIANNCPVTSTALRYAVESDNIEIL